MMWIRNGVNTYIYPITLLESRIPFYVIGPSKTFLWTIHTFGNVIGRVRHFSNEPPPIEAIEKAVERPKQEYSADLDLFY